MLIVIGIVACHLPRASAESLRYTRKGPFDTADCGSVCSPPIERGVSDLKEASYYLRTMMRSPECRVLCASTEARVGQKHGARVLVQLVDACIHLGHFDWTRRDSLTTRHVRNCLETYLPLLDGAVLEGIRDALDGVESPRGFIHSEQVPAIAPRHHDAYGSRCSRFLALILFPAFFAAAATVFLLRILRYERIRRRMKAPPPDFVACSGTIMEERATDAPPVEVELEVDEGATRFVEVRRTTSTRPFSLRSDGGATIGVECGRSNLALWTELESTPWQRGSRYRWRARVSAGMRVFVHGPARDVYPASTTSPYRSPQPAEPRDSGTTVVISTRPLDEPPRRLRSRNLRSALALLGVLLLAEGVGFGDYFLTWWSSKAVLGVFTTRTIGPADPLFLPRKQQMGTPVEPQFVSVVHLERSGKGEDYLPCRGGLEGALAPMLMMRDQLYLQPEPTTNKLNLWLGVGLLLAGTMAVLVRAHGRTPWYFQKRVKQRSLRQAARI